MTKSSNWPLKAAALAVLSVAASTSWAVGLGRLNVLSALGENLRANIEVLNLTPQEAETLKVKVASPDVYRKAGVDFNAALSSATVALRRMPDGRPYLALNSVRSVQEPFVDVILELTTSEGRMVREYTVLLDPPTAKLPESAGNSTEPRVVPQVTTPRPIEEARASEPLPPIPNNHAEPVVQVPQRTAVSAYSPDHRPPKAVTRTRETSPVKKTTTPGARKPAVARAGAVRVKRGQTLSTIAARLAPRGVSLDQVMIGLLKSNPDAFVDGNINRLKSGVVLRTPSATQLKATTAPEASRMVLAQSADFNAYRQRLASGAAPQADKRDRAAVASGKVQAQVQDRRSAQQPNDDKLTLTKAKPIEAGKPALQEDKLLQAKAKQDQAAREAELKKNMQELQRLQQQASSVPVAPVAATTQNPASAASASAVPAKVAAAAASAASAVNIAASAAVHAASSAVNAGAASAMVGTAVSTAASAASAVGNSSPVVKPRPAPVPPTTTASTHTSSDNMLPSWALPAGLVTLLGLGGVGAYLYRKQKNASHGETSFLESQMQPESFFGGAGGQRVDTNDQGPSSTSSVGYSLSQLDAIGDVDPVAEADVYLAYGRDLQAEEILKEAMRSGPDRMAVRTKLLEVYAKRRDTKAFELLASQIYAITNGQGEDWAHVQSMGAVLDATNPLYQPGGQPVAVIASRGRAVEPLGATTLPQSILPTPHQKEAQPSEPAPVMQSMDLNLPPLSAGSASVTAVTSVADSGTDLGLDFVLDAGADGDEALSRKIELAEELRQIGDVDGAKELLQEVIQSSHGALQSKAKTIFDTLS